MKLIIKEYLASLKERDELDVILPDLLSQMGLTIISKPQQGTKQLGVDVSAYGYLNSKEKKVYLLSIKGGDLTRKAWNDGTPQALLPSLDEIRIHYVSQRLPGQYRNKPIVICLCFGGEIRDGVSDYVNAYTEKYSSDEIKFEIWNGDYIAQLVLDNFLKEDLMSGKIRSMLRKSLALLNEPNASYNYFAEIINNLLYGKYNEKEQLLKIRQTVICLWILFAWCRNEDNIEAAYLSSELAVLYAWELVKKHKNKKSNISKFIVKSFNLLLELHRTILKEYVEKIASLREIRYGASMQAQPRCSVDLNLRMFDMLGRITLLGVWTSYKMECSTSQEDKERAQKELNKINEHIKIIIKNNPILYTPYRDDQAIDIFMILWLLSGDSNNLDFINEYLSKMILLLRFNYENNGVYPSTLFEYGKLITHPLKHDIVYKEEITCSSILYTVISIFLCIHNLNDAYAAMVDFKKNHLEHCNFQWLYLNKGSEDHVYTNKDKHGSSLMTIPIDKGISTLLERMFEECNKEPFFDELSAIKLDMWPLIFMACRHYRLPPPINFLMRFRQS